MPNGINYEFCDDEDDDIDVYEGSFRISRAPYWDGTEWSDEDISECPGLED